MIIVLAASAWLGPCARAQSPEPDAKSVPKAILMLGLYCNAANTVLKLIYEKNPSLTPWRATGKREKAFTELFSKVDFNRNGNAKAVRDKALTENEVKFLDLTAQKEAANWGLAAHEKCGFEPDPDRLEICLRNLNSEIYKCHQQLNDQAEKLMQAQ